MTAPFVRCAEKCVGFVSKLTRHNSALWLGCLRYLRFRLLLFLRIIGEAVLISGAGNFILIARGCSRQQSRGSQYYYGESTHHNHVNANVGHFDSVRRCAALFFLNTSSNFTAQFSSTKKNKPHGTQPCIQRNY